MKDSRRESAASPSDKKDAHTLVNLQMVPHKKTGYENGQAKQNRVPFEIGLNEYKPQKLEFDPFKQIKEIYKTKKRLSYISMYCGDKVGKSK